jgi:hypothetical protein
MYAAIRRYQIDPQKAPEAMRIIFEDFVPVIRQSPGVLAYYVLEAQEGQFATLSVFESQAAVEVPSPGVGAPGPHALLVWLDDGNPYYPAARRSLLPLLQVQAA